MLPTNKSLVEVYDDVAKKTARTLEGTRFEGAPKYGVLAGGSAALTGLAIDRYGVASMSTAAAVFSYAVRNEIQATKEERYHELLEEDHPDNSLEDIERVLG